MFLGFYNLANFMTLLGLASSVTAIFAAMALEFKWAVLLFAFAGVCDALDGKFARNRLDSGDPRKAVYGMMLDSLCDLVSFGATPCVIAYAFGNKSAADLVIYLFFITCGCIRLAYYNTRALCSDGKARGFVGVPITTSVIAFPFIIMLAMFVPPLVVGFILRAFFVVLGLLFIFKVKVNRLSAKAIVISVLIAAAAIAIMFALPNVPINYLQ